MDLSIDYNQTRQLGNSILEKANDFSEVLNKITSENDNLKNSWKGSDADKYTASGNTIILTPSFLKKLNTPSVAPCEIPTHTYKTINEMGEFLISAASAYQRVNETNQDGIR